jgi:hypothetical protein
MDLADLIVEREEEGYFAYHRSALTSDAIHRAERPRGFSLRTLRKNRSPAAPTPPRARTLMRAPRERRRATRNAGFDARAGAPNRLGLLPRAGRSPSNDSACKSPRLARCLYPQGVPCRLAALRPRPERVCTRARRVVHLRPYGMSRDSR